MPYFVFKRCLDVVGALLLLILVLPVLATASLLVWFSGMPIIFTQQRVGQHGRIFRVFKLDTMRRAPFQVCISLDDPRITRVGRWLRRTRIDELPQLINVLRGEMSLVGPRPLPVEVIGQIRHQPAYPERELVRPGITGLAKVRNPSGIHQLDSEMHAADLEYIRGCGLWLDLQILFRTPWAVLRDIMRPRRMEAAPAGPTSEALTSLW